MGASTLDRLYEKVHQATTELTGLKKERQKLVTEVELMQEENRRARRVLREHDELLKERKKIQAKLEHILEKLEKLKI